MKRHWLRGIAVALIVLPEPLTTPVGVMLLLTSYLLPKRQKDNIRKLESLVKRYLNTREPSHNYRVSPIQKQPVSYPVNYQVSPSAASSGKDLVTTWHYPKESASGTIFQYRYVPGSSAGNKVVHHVLRTRLPYYNTLPQRPGKIIQQTLNTTGQTTFPDTHYSRLKTVGPLPRPQKVVHHTLKRQML